MLPYQNLIRLDRQSSVPIYVQMVNQLVQLIQKGQLSANTKLPGTRKLASLLAINRNTVVRAIEELEATGWVEIRPNRGAFVATNLPQLKTRKWSITPSAQKDEQIQYHQFPELHAPTASSGMLGFDDGLPDVRLAPIDALAKAYTRNLRKLAASRDLRYSDAMGNAALRNALANMLNTTRGLNIDANQILITRGTIMAIHLAFAASIQRGDKVIVGTSNYFTANMVIRYFGGKLIQVPVDQNGIVVEAVAAICSQQTIRAIYVTSHHHHPTTVTLSPERRLTLMQLAEKYGFIILEDDYDYDFHYDNNPILPLKSNDRLGQVLYFGSFTKAIAPAFRVGFLVAPSSLIHSLVKLRRILDRQGDQVLEATIAELLEDGTIRRHLRKSWKQYKDRRDYLASLLSHELGDRIAFQVPAGGLAIWTHFNLNVSFDQLKERAKKNQLQLSNASFECTEKWSASRLGFASLNFREIDECIDKLKKTIQVL